MGPRPGRGPHMFPVRSPARMSRKLFRQPSACADQGVTLPNGVTADVAAAVSRVSRRPRRLCERNRLSRTSTLSYDFHRLFLAIFIIFGRVSDLARLS